MDDYPAGYAGQSYSLSYGAAQNEPAKEDPALHNTEAEAALLGALMIANDFIPIVAERVAAEDFFEPLHGRIFRSIVRLHERGRSPNPIILRPIFESDPDIAELGGPGYLAKLTGHGAAVIGTVDFADQIAELAVRRRVVDAMREGMERLVDPSAVEGLEEVDDVVSQVSDVAYLSMTRAAPMKPKSSAAIIRRVRTRQEEISAGDGPIGAMCKSITDMDTMIGLAEAGTYNVIGGRPGMCKTTLACSAAWGYAAAGFPTEYFHGEMTADQMGMRHAADLSHAMRIAIAHDKIRKGELTEAELRMLDQVAEMAETLPLNFVATGACDIRRVEAAVARAVLKWKNKGRKLAVVWLDYLQKFTATDARGRLVTDPTEAASLVSSACARMAQRFEVAVFALAQLGRQVEERKDKRPQMSDLKQSGRIEEDADSVTLLFRPEYYLAKERPRKDPASEEFQRWETDMRCVEGQIEMIGEKNRHGKPRTRTVKFIGSQYAVRSGSWSDVDAPILAPDLFADTQAQAHAEGW